MAVAAIFKKAYSALAIAAALYFIFLGLLSIEWLQRHAFYAHKVHTAWWRDLNKPEQFGFSKNQITPFYINTPDREMLYAWHILPLGLYAKNEGTLLGQQPGPAKEITEAVSFRLLAGDPESRLIINCQPILCTCFQKSANFLQQFMVKNAGTVGQGWRTDTYRSLASGSTDKIHVLTVDYRGYGYSTGRPTEEGLIVDGVALVDWALKVAGIPPERIVLLGQSLGTAVTTAVAEHYATSSQPVEFAGVVLVAAFTDVPTLLLTYSIAGLVPILSPLRPYPFLQKFFSRQISDTWNTASRLANFVRVSRKIRLFLIHAQNDFDIPWKHSDALFYIAANATSEKGMTERQVDNVKSTTQLGEAGWINTWNAGGDKIIRQEIVRHGGHNRVVTYAPVALAAFKAFGT
ncbi:MAG: hypothetical protein M1827_002041 [Pycnora praestabilis]|nr:MAG: hypothetical protein M1827_002041 [Pycnora praestabilis]